MDEKDALGILSTIPHLGSIRIRLLIKHFGSATQVLEQKPQHIVRLPGFSDRMLADWSKYCQGGFWEQNCAIAEKLAVEIIPFTDKRYPKRLLEIPDHPIILYMKGVLVQKDEQSLAVIGTRFASKYGLECAYKQSAELAAAGFTIVSGLAKGIDTAAHQGALTKGRTIAVLGSGIADIYPRENEKLAAQIAEKGVVISEFPVNAPPERSNFPQRNRIVAAMTKGSWLVEAPLDSGAMITMRKAQEYNRPLFALPGRVDMESFMGNHMLVKTGAAKLVEDSNDIISFFGDLLCQIKKKGMA